MADYVFESFYAPHLYAGRSVPGDEQAAIERMVERILLELAMNRYDWKGLPDSVSSRWLELNLATRGLAIFFKDEEITNNFVALSGSGYGNLDLQGNYTQFQVWGNGMAFFNQTMKAKDVVPIWANFLRSSDMDIVRIYARRIAIFDRSIEINAENSRRTKIIPMTENRRLTFDNINRQIQRGDAFIKVTDSIVNLLGQMEALDLGIDPVTIVNLDIARGRQWNAVLTLLGINNSNQDKKERLVAAEVSGNDDEIENIRNIGLQSRKIAAEQINARFGLNVSVDFKTEVATQTLVDPAGAGSAGSVDEKQDRKAG